MTKRSLRRIESPEKMPVITTGIEMTRGARKDENPNAKEYLTGGNGVADETKVASLVTRFVQHFR